MRFLFIMFGISTLYLIITLLIPFIITLTFPFMPEDINEKFIFILIVAYLLGFICFLILSGLYLGII